MVATLTRPPRQRLSLRARSTQAPLQTVRAAAPLTAGSTVLVPVADLVGKPGATRSLHRTIAVEDVGDDPWGPAEEALVGDIELDLGLDSVIEGIWLHGDVRWQLRLDCGRCLRPVELDRDAEVGELYADPRRVHAEEDVDEGYELVEDASAIDLERLLHDLVVLDLPTSVRCGREDCVAPVGEGVAVLDEDELRARREGGPDPRWAALADLDLSDSTN